MNVFVFEFVSGGGLAREPLPPALVREGDMMLHALLGDLTQLPDVRVATSRDPRLPPLADIAAITPAPGEDALALYRRGAGAADAAWPLAPETGGALERLARATLALGTTLLGCRPDAVRLAGSKRATAAALRAAGVRVVPTFGAGDWIPPLPGPWVIKPDDGAGCDGALLVSDWRAAAEGIAVDPARLVAQPWIEGSAVSLSLLCREGHARLLCANRQLVRIVDGRPALEAISVNDVSDPDGRLAALAGRIAAAIPGLWGYVGVDLVLAGPGPLVLEVNPRVTTSYCGLRRALAVNPAGLVLDLLVGGGADHLAPARRGAPLGTTATVLLETGRGD